MKVTRKKKLRFLQLYTSQSYENRRSELLTPSDELNDGRNVKVRFRRTSSTEDLQKHALSPRLVNAISRKSQLLWANCQNREGLLGRSDMRLQTAVGLPVAMDTDGSMCIVIMFSPNNLQSNDAAVDYLRSISKSATSTSIPCLLPVVEKGRNLLNYNENDSNIVVEEDISYTPSAQDIAGTTTRLVSFLIDEGSNSIPADPAEVSYPDVHTVS